MITKCRVYKILLISKQRDLPLYKHLITVRKSAWGSLQTLPLTATFASNLESKQRSDPVLHEVNLEFLYVYLS